MPPRKKSRKEPPAAKRSLDFGNDDNDKVDLTEDFTPAPAVTPVKKQKKRDLRAFFSSPTSTAAATTNNAAPVVTPLDVKKRKLDVSSTPTKKKKLEDEDQKREDGYVPTYVHKNVSYVREGKAELDPSTAKVFQLVEEHYVVPEGFENDRSYGPLSGVCFEERVIASYRNNLLKPKNQKDVIEICTHCADVGHKRDDCQELI